MGKEGAYDLLRKNCNSFTDVALFFTLGKRLDQKYMALEQIGADVDQVGLIRLLSLGDYVPNPLANTFRIDQVLQHAERGRRASANSADLVKTPSKDLKKEPSDASQRKPNQYFVGQ